MKKSNKNYNITTFSFLPFGIINYFSEMIRKECEKSGHVCRLWVNQDIMNDLVFLDKKDNGKRAETYWLQCHSPSLTYNPHTGNIILKCCPNDITLGSRAECLYSNPNVEIILKNKLDAKAC